MQRICAFAGLTGIQFRVRLPGLFLKLELVGPMIPIGDLFDETVFDRCFRLVDQGDLSVADLLEVPWYDLSDRVSNGLLVQPAGDPGALGTRKNLLDAGLTFVQRTVIQVRRVVQMSRGAIRLIST